MAVGWRQPGREGGWAHEGEREGGREGCTGKAHSAQKVVREKEREREAEASQENKTNMNTQQAGGDA